MLGKLGCIPNSLAMEDAALVHGAKDKRRTRAKKIVLDVFAEADETFRKIFRFVLFDLPDVEIDEAHREHVVGEEGELVFFVLVVRLERFTQSIYAFMLRDFPSDTSCQV